MTTSPVRVLNITHVLPDQEGQAAVHSPRRLPDDGLLKLSFLDAMFINRVPIQRLFFYEGPNVPPFPALVRSLQSSLAAALASFVPLAGKLTYRPATRDVVVDCTADAVSPGVAFVEAVYSGSIGDMRRIAVGDDVASEVLLRLTPEMNSGRLPAPVLAVQVTRPAIGEGNAVVVGVAIHHAVADGLSVWRFMRAWCAACQTGSGQAATSGLEPPMFDRTVIRYPGSDSDEAVRKFLHAVAPALPVASSLSMDIPPDLRRRSFLLGADQIQFLKQRILAQSDAMGEQLCTHPSTFVAVSSLVWTSIMRAKQSLDPTADAYYLVPLDLRRRLVPPVDDRFFGNCLGPSLARATVHNLRDEGAGLARAAAAFRAAIAAAPKGDPLGGVDGWIKTLASLPTERFTMSGSSNRFMAYETDFGWGAPSCVELVALFSRVNVLLLGARDGGVQVAVQLHHAHMDGFVTHFLRLVGQIDKA